MARTVYWRGGNGWGEGHWGFDGRQGDPNGVVADDSNWVLDDGTPTYAPEDGDTIVFDDHAGIVPDPIMSGWDEDEFNAYMNDQYSQYRYFDDAESDHGHERGKHWDCNIFYLKYLSYNDYVFSGHWAFKELIVKPEYTGQIGFMRKRVWNAELNYYQYIDFYTNPLPCHFESGGGIILDSEREHHFRCSDKHEQIDLVGSTWTQGAGALPGSVSIDKLQIVNPLAVAIISSQFNEATKRSKWGTIDVLKGTCYALAKEYLKYFNDTWMSIDDYFESALGTVVGLVNTYGDDTMVQIGRGCVDKSNSDAPADLTAYRGQVYSQSHLGNIINWLAHINVGQYNMYPNTKCNIDSLINHLGTLLWYAGGTWAEGQINGGKVKLYGGNTKKIGVDADTIQLNNGILDLGSCTGRLYLGINNCNVLKKGGKFIAKDNNEYSYIPS